MQTLIGRDSQMVHDKLNDGTKFGQLHDPAPEHTVMLAINVHHGYFHHTRRGVPWKHHAERKRALEVRVTRAEWADLAILNHRSGLMDRIIRSCEPST